MPLVTYDGRFLTDGTLAGYLSSVADIPALRAVNTHEQGYIIGVQSPLPGEMYMFNATSTAADDGVNVIKPADILPGDPGRWLLMTGGGGGGTVTTETLTIPFAYNSASPVLIKAVIAGQTIVSTEIQITTVFDDPTATLQVGTPATPGLVVPTTDNFPDAIGVYRTDTNFPFGGVDTVQLTITPGASTQGAGVVVIQFKI